MDSQLKNLILLQDVDSKIFEINSIAGDLPEKIKRKEDSINQLNSKLSETNERVEQLEKENRKLSAQNEDGQAQLEKHKDQLFLVKSNKEYDALNEEIEHLKIKIAASENQFLEFEIEREKLVESRESNESEVNRLEEVLTKEKQRLSKAFDESKIELESLNSNRKDIEQKVDSDHLLHYNRLRLKDAMGLGLAPLNEGSCGSCYSTLPPQMIIEIKSNKIIHSCPSCSIIIFWKDEEKN